MNQLEFETVVKSLSQLSTVPEIVERLKQSEVAELAEAANALSGQFSLAEVESERRIYHVFTETNDQGDAEEFVEWIMNEGDDTIKFVAWFFDTMFEVKKKETYKAAGKTYQQPKRH